jgi:two-component system, NtrC family, response regulator AtoC
LRERREDIPRLIEHFAEKYGKRYQRPMEVIPPEVMQRLLAYEFPGNIRELENLVRRLIVLRDPRYILGELQTRNVMVEPPPQAQIVAFPSEAALARPAATPMTYGYPPQPPLGASEPGVMHVTVRYEISSAPPGQIDDDYTIDLKGLGRKAADAAEREAIIIMLRHTGGNKREAADRLGISYKAILYKIREFGIGRPRQRRPAAPPPVAATEAEDCVADDAIDLVG